MLTRNGYGKAVDWWALGALCFEMVSGRAPFTAPSEKELFKKIMFEKFTSPSFLTAAAHSLLKGLLDKDM
jgi:serine/threonine protein kinase